jgi:predicted nuclease with TOPRIM domain
MSQMKDQLQSLQATHETEVQEITAAKEALVSELDRIRNQLIDVSTELAKTKAKQSDLSSNLKKSNDTVQHLMEKETTLAGGVKAKMEELSAQHDKWKAKV